ncbi:Fanconi anemia group M protein isoform X2 [Passer domesticus]|uniref:Fanconi anemia group M protein isoform X2 n=1 Tax=Passer domesticus TaxID=48849 RepID=UPI0030FF11E5
MSGGRQRTLPQAWRAGGAERRDAGSDSDDELLLAAAAAADSGPPQGFSRAAGSIWIYPTNLPVRPYQERMAGAALLANTLVCLPTGLGKTFVAAVVMYNFYRWFPSGKVLFLAPTKPLVAQQMEACGRVMGIPARDMAEMTGGTQALGRRELWNTKRVFFLTPQIMVNDLSRGTCPAVEIKCLVIDEAHKALGNHAYCQVVRELSKYTSQFRVLALSATPGSDTKAVQQVISNLLIAQIEVCAEDSPEIQPYSHERQVEKIVVPLGEELLEIQNTYIKVLEAFAGRLIKVGVLSRRDIPSLTKYQIILARDQYRKNPSAQNAGIHQGIIEGDFALCISLYHGYELLLQMGIRSLFIYLWGIMDGSKGLSRTKSELGRNGDFMELYQQLQDMFSDSAVAPEAGSVGKSTTASEKKKEFIYSHPKLKKLEEIVIEHFRSWKQGGSGEDKSEGSPGDTRVMIFSSFRDSVQEIAEMLARLSPAVRAMTFVGHSSGKSTKGFTQKEQLEVVRRFREGGYNTLVSTCVGEEGLDIGEVDLIVCFDAQRSPVRLVQRMGRAGRRRRGRIVVILAQGREERTYNQSQSNKRSIHKAISGNKTLRFYQHSPRMVPEGINPKVHKMFITAEKQEQSTSRLLSKKRRCSSLQHKSALSACVTGQKQMNSHGSWCLSPEEFEIWDRLYRIKESDGIKEPVLPRVQFETLENLEETPFPLQKPEEGAARELSLSEWSIWQNQPLPTVLVDHSDPCHLFIGAMEMMELMRHQQGDCSYELELQPHLHLEDVNIPGNKRNPSMAKPPRDQRGHCSRRDLPKPKPKPFPPDAGDSESEFFSTFKITKAKAPRGAPALREVPELPREPPAPPSGTRLAVPGHPHPGSDKDEGLEVTFDLNAFIDLCDNSDSSEGPASPAAQENSPAGEACGALGRIHRDSGYETSPVASDLFYLPESCRESFTLQGPPREPPGLEQTFSQVQRLLSQSPPCGEELEGLESLMRDEGTRSPSPKVLPKGHSEALQDSVSPTSPKTDPSLLLLENPKVAAPREFCASRSPPLSKTVSSTEAAAVEEEQLWNDSFDGLFDSEEFPEMPNNAPSRDHPLTKEPFLPRDAAEAALEVPAEEQSLHLFEDEAAEDTGEGSPMSTEPPARAGPAGSIPGTEGEPGRELPTQACRESLGTSAVALEKDGPYDCSQELFSVTFDLGFSIEDSGDESCEESSNAGHPKVSGAPGSAETALGDGSRLETSPGWDCSRLQRRAVSTPLSRQSWGRAGREGAGGAPAARPGLESGGSRRGREPPEPLPSALLTPTSRKGVNIKAVKRISMKVFSNAREQIPEVPPVDQVRESPWRQNVGRSAMDSPPGRTESLENTNLHGSHAAGPSSDSEEEIVFQRKNRMKKNVLKSPDGMDESDLESPARVTRKRRRPPNVSDTSSEDSGDFQRGRSGSRARPRPGGAKRARSCVTAKAAARQFLDSEAELSLLDAEGISSDESDGSGEELSSSLAQFLNDEGETTQALNDSEMRGVYLSSVRSPALGSRFKMVHGEFSPSAVFSQIPEQDVAYAEDSFCVGDEEEEEEEAPSEEELCVDAELLPAEGCSSSRRQYLTRRRKRLGQARLAGNAPAPGQKKKPSRIIVLSDSSEEEEAGAGRKKPLEAGQGKGQLPRALPSAPSAQHGSREEGTAPQAGGQDTERLLGLEPSVSGMLDPPPEQAGRSSSIPPAGSGCRNTDLQAAAEVYSSLKKTHGSSSGSVCPAVPNSSSATARISSVPGEHGPSPAGICPVPGEHGPSPAGICPVPGEHGRSLCILADSREICSGPEVLSCLRAVHGLRVQVCSLGTSDYIVSNRLAVDRLLQSELQSPGNRNKLSQRLQRLQGIFERICVIVETDRVRPGETSRCFQRTQYYDGVLSALVQAGIRILFSSCQEETAALLKELALLEHRKDAAIQVPTEPEGHRRDILSFYLSIPNLSYGAALNLCHCFGSITAVANSSVPALAAGARLSRPQAEELHRFLRHDFDLQLLPQPPAKGKS